MILADTTILVYAVGVEHNLRDPCRMLIRAVAESRVRACTTVEVIQEFAHVRSRRRPRADAVALARSFALGLAPLAGPDEGELDRGLDLFEHSESLSAFDSVLAAVALARGWALASADSAFGRVDGLAWVDPGSNSFERDVLAAG